MPLDNKFTHEIITDGNRIIADANKTGELTSGLERLLTLLKDAKLAWCARMDPAVVGVHQANRSSLGVVGADAQILGGEILQTGFSMKKATDRAVAIAVDGSNTSAIQFNTELCNMSN